MLNQDLNSPLTSSAGRLFDAVSSILGECHRVKYEAEAAIKLERLANKSQEKGSYNLDIIKEDKAYIIGYNTLIKGILSDIKKKVPKQDIARKFHNSLVVMIIKMVDKISKEHNLRDVVLSGGVFQNRILFDSTFNKLRKYGYNLIYSDRIPLNDLGICLGQAFIASNSK